MLRPELVRVACAGGAAIVLAGCDPKEAPRVDVPVFVDASAVVPVDTDLGYRVELTEARLVLRDFQFTIGGELHVSLWKALSDFLVPDVQAHPGHVQAGDVTGELLGRFVVDWGRADGASLGTATLLAGRYEGANFEFASAEGADGGGSEPLMGHTAYFAGTATSGDDVLAFEARLDSPAGRLLVGVPCAVEVAADGGVELGFQLTPLDEHESDTLFDGVDFAALADGAGRASIAAEFTDEAHVDAYNRLLRTFQTHDHFAFSRRAARDASPD